MTSTITWRITSNPSQRGPSVFQLKRIAEAPCGFTWRFLFNRSRERWNSAERKQEAACCSTLRNRFFWNVTHKIRETKGRAQRRRGGESVTLSVWMKNRRVKVNLPPRLRGCVVIVMQPSRTFTFIHRFRRLLRICCSYATHLRPVCCCKAALPHCRTEESLWTFSARVYTLTAQFSRLSTPHHTPGSLRNKVSKNPIYKFPAKTCLESIFLLLLFIIGATRRMLRTNTRSR